MKPKAVMNWSGGKDSSLALHRVLQADEVEVVALLTTLNKQYERVSMHGVREALLDAQADAIGLPLIKVWLGDEPTMAQYEQAMDVPMEELQSQGVTVSIFGDIFLEDLRKYREERLAACGMKGLFPLWQCETKTLAEMFVEMGFKGITTSVSGQMLGEAWVGRTMDEVFFEQLPNEVDPCGENGEYHSFVYAGPHMREIAVKVGEKTYREYSIADSDLPTDDEKKMGYWYCDLTLD